MLLYGTALGVARKVTKYLPLILSHSTVAAVPAWYYATGAGGKTLGVQGLGVDFATGFSQNIGDLSTAFSSIFSSGPGGEFSDSGSGGAS